MSTEFHRESMLKYLFKSRGIVSAEIKNDTLSLCCNIGFEDNEDGRYCITNLPMGDKLLNLIVDYVREEKEQNHKAFYHFISYDKELYWDIQMFAVSLSSLPNQYNVYSKGIKNSPYFYVCICDFFYDIVVDWIKLQYDKLWELKRKHGEISQSSRQYYMYLEEPEYNVNPHFQLNKEPKLSGSVYVDTNEFWKGNK